METNGGPQTIRRKRKLFSGLQKFSAILNLFSEVSEIPSAWVFLHFDMVKYNSDRDEKLLLKIRPVLFIEACVGEIEVFQNETLRPILKMQHNIMVDFILSQPNFDSVLKHRLVRFLFEAKLKEFINQPQLKGQLIGMVIGHFTSDEMKCYTNNNKEINKRISQMLLQRFADSI